MFDEIAGQYDRLCNVMSFGIELFIAALERMTESDSAQIQNTGHSRFQQGSNQGGGIERHWVQTVE